jgi:hypothetical protein
MPLHSYHADRRPPTVADHILAHCWEMGVAAWGIIAGALSVVAALSDFSASTAMSVLPWWTLGVLGALLVVGGVATIWGLLDDAEDLRRGWRVERSGLILSGTAWAAYTASLIVSFPTSIVGWLLTAILSACAVLRYVATVLEERRIRLAIEEMQ